MVLDLAQENKYLACTAGESITFKSVVLVSVHDIKNLKLAIRDESDTRFNSPWNIAADYDIDMTFTAMEISVMLTEYAADNDLDFDINEMSEEIYKLTNGYPYLVSRICQLIDEKLKRIGRRRESTTRRSGYWKKEALYSMM